jgi:hypothetical protein
MIMRMTWGKLRAGTWNEYEQAYKATVAGKAVPGLRGRWLAQDVHDPDGGFAVRGIHLSRDNLVSVMYAEELSSNQSSATLQRTDRHGILGQKSPDFQLVL